jgi:DNA-binding response OmpR family regulator/anti-sigma regulatory factor (Ser/Thr protein kinase)
MSSQVLIVDDSLTVRMDLVEGFEAAGMRPLPCATVREARAALGTQPIDLVVLDVLLPDGDGVELLGEIRSSDATGTLLVLLLSTEAQVQARVRGLSRGADDYIGKPYDRDYVVARARDLLRARQIDSAGRLAETRLTILVIDDSATFREQLREELERAGYNVVAAATGEDGLRMAAVHRPAAIIVDGAMPGIDGPTVIRRLRLDVALRGTPCLLLTAAEERGAELQALDAGADAFVRKEEDLSVILARLGAILRGTEVEPREGASLAGPKRILAVDDSETYLQEIASQLREQGYDVVVARSGEEAIDLLRVQPVDCILLDLLMPGIGGQETCRRIKSAPALRNIALIMLTAVENRETLISGLATGADDYISKASDFDVVHARIQAQIRRRQFEDENRRIREQLLHSKLEAAEARAARQLAEAKAMLVEKLERSNEEVRRLNEDLEQRVAERTRELERANDDLRRTQQSMMQQERLRAFGQMASGVAHDVNNALSPATLYLETLIEQETGLSARGRDQLTTVQRAIDDVAQTIARMREFYRGRDPQPRLEPVQLNDVVTQTIELTRARWSDIPQERGIVIHLTTDLAAELPVLTGAESELRDAMRNLVLNAVDAMPEGGTLTVRTRAIPRQDTAWNSSRRRPAVGAVQVEVCDSGVGMDEETRSRCIEPFFTTKGERGTGLGLAMVYGMAQRHGATFEIDSEASKGTTMRLIFPVGAGAGPAIEASQPVRPRSRDLQILLIDDDRPLLEALQEILERDGHHVTTACGGQAGIDAFRSAERGGTRFAVVITDLGMPYVDGRRVAAAIKDTSPTTPVILLTGWGHRLIAEGDQPEYVDRVLSKPPSMVQLRAAFAELLSAATGGTG